MTTDYTKVGLKVGLEIHQQLATPSKMFCNCNPELSTGDPEWTFIRSLRPTQSELGQIDPAALFEFQKGARILYEADPENSCLVEMDEEPPHRLSEEAIRIALTTALMMKSTPVDEIHVMRKTVIVGSNTTGFQRTCVVALNGQVQTEQKEIPIQHVGLEEDAARRTKGRGKLAGYRIDRLGVPLIEIATAPVIKTPQEAQQVALAIGRLLRATGGAKRGIGTIRQDINISISRGALVEIKGVQKLELVSQVVDHEVQRQLRLLQIKEKLTSSGLTGDEIKEEIVNATDAFQASECRVLREAIKKKKVILALKLPKMKGFLKQELMPDYRLGTDMADRAKFWGRVGGIFHTDELPAYGITEEEVETLRKMAKADEHDAVILVADEPENAEDALRAVAERARELLRSVPQETRAARPDGTTRYMRPRPGSARMYPETDIPPIQITQDQINRIRQQLPEMPEAKLQRLMKEHKLNRKLASQLTDSAYLKTFEEIVRESEVSPTVVASFLTETLKALDREGVQIEKIGDSQLREAFKKISIGELTKEALPDVFTWLADHERADVQEAILKLGLRALSEDELRKSIRKLVEKDRKLVEDRGEGSIGVLMNAIMRELRGKADASLAIKILKEEIRVLLK